jgi:hypothetical protein
MNACHFSIIPSIKLSLSLLRLSLLRLSLLRLSLLRYASAIKAHQAYYSQDQLC